ncbi:CgeB family protein [Maridesulfovibrio sp. FT414]|uniref:CgeB family protein n=1 Tax=Maridesulfovibrio sp. FT414 TaxID=2979469 RepID=UPI003D800298
MPMIRVPCIKGQSPRILLIAQNYFIIPELVRALKSLGISFVSVKFRQDESFLRELFERIGRFRPHFVLSVNHAGLDGAGQVLDLLRRCGVPFASWFVDRQELYMRAPVPSESLLAVFTWDPEALPFLAVRNVSHAHYLPLGTDPSVFRPGGTGDALHRVSFVGSSWTGKVGDVLRAGRFPVKLLRSYRPLAELLESGVSADPQGLIARAGEEAALAFEGLSTEKQAMFLRLVSLQATRIRRVRAVSALLDFSPVVVGDAYWGRELGRSGKNFTLWNRLSYETELPEFYRSSLVNFNSTSLQSQASVNQRVFDVPACGGFLLTERTAALEALFEPGREVACYNCVDEISETVARWIADGPGRTSIARAGLERVLACHTYQHRVAEIVSKMRAFY